MIKLKKMIYILFYIGMLLIIIGEYNTLGLFKSLLAVGALIVIAGICWLIKKSKTKHKNKKDKQ